MTSAADVRQVTNTLAGEESTSSQPASGFTAVNGRSPAEQTSRPQQSQQDGLTREQDMGPGTTLASGANNTSQASPELDLNSSAPSASPGQYREDVRTSPGKRKRSLSEDVSPSTRSLSPSKRYRSPGLEQADRETQPPGGNSGGGNLTNGTPNSTNVNGNHTNGVSALEQDTRYSDPNGQQWNLQRDGEMQDAQFAEALTRGTQQLHDTSQQIDPIDTNPDPKYTPHTPQSASHPQHAMSTMQPVVAGQLAPSFQKQRKRNFSNRTKTGCLTCRSRKKKCDEAKPTCKNCERGGFTCQGYSQANLSYKAANLNASAAPLQAKSGVAFIEPYPYTNHVRPGPPPPPSAGFFPEHSQLPPTGDRDRNLPNAQDSHIRSQYGRPSWSDSQQGGPFPQENLQSGPPMADHRGERTLPPPPNTQPGGPQRSGSSSSHYTQLAQSALQHPGANNRSAPPQPQPYWSEKDKMIHGHPFARNDPQLVEDRKQCATACHKFNLNASDPQNLNDAERYTRFRQIIQPKSSTSTTRSPPGSEAGGEGCVGERVSVEAPFNCEYGYNISIGDDTEIGPGCRIMDSCTVKIGARCYIGPNVTFYTTEGDQQPAQLGPGGRKQKRLTRASAIIVEDDVYIAGNVVVQPGQRIGNSATIAAGTMLDRIQNMEAQISSQGYGDRNPMGLRYPDAKSGLTRFVSGFP